MMHRRLSLVLVSIVLAGVALVFGQQRDAGDVLARIRAEGLQRSRALALYRTLTDEIGARLTGSPAHLQAARWARDRFAEWGLANPHLEPYEFGRGWQLEHVSVEMTEPRYVPLIAYADAWSPSTAGVVSGRAVYIGDKTAEQIEAMAGAASRRDRADPSSANRVRRSRPAAARSRRPPGGHWQPGAAGAAEGDTGQRPDGPAQENGRRRRVAAECVPRRHGRCHRESRHSLRRGAHDRGCRRAIQRDRSTGRPGTTRVAARRAADALLRRGSQQLQRHRRDPGTGSEAARRDRAAWRAPRFLAHGERRH